MHVTCTVPQQSIPGWIRPALSGTSGSLLLADLLSVKALQFGEFTLASGKRSSYYVDIKRAVTQPRVLDSIAKAMTRYTSKVDRIAGVELGAVPIATAVGLQSGKPILLVRKQRKEHGLSRDFEGELSANDRVLFVEDVVTTGGTLRAAIERMRDHGALVEDCVCVVDREEGGRMVLAEIGVRLHSLLAAKDLLSQQ